MSWIEGLEVSSIKKGNVDKYLIVELIIVTPSRVYADTMWTSVVFRTTGVYII